MVCALIRKDYATATSCAEKLYGNAQYVDRLASAILGDIGNVKSEELAFNFLDVMIAELGANEILPCLTNEAWKAYVGEKAVKPLIDSIQDEIEVAKKSKGKGASARLEAGKKLRKNTDSVLKQLKTYLSSSDLRYQMTADKLGIEILQCGIDYYNDSDEPDAAHKAMELQRYALSVVVGQMAKDRCKENVGILEDVISKLPPLEVMASHKAINSLLAVFATQPNSISCSIQLLKDCAPHVVEIKEKLGKAHRYYLKISTLIVGCALGNIIAEVNENQRGDFEALKSVLVSAWRAQLYMDKFDLEPEFKEGRYKECREALHGIIEKCKGFENPHLSFMYPYGCGWCNGLRTSDLDLRTEEEYYQSCDDLTSYKSYLKKYPAGKYSEQAESKIELLTFQAAQSIEELEGFVRQYPNSQLVAEAKKRIVDLRATMARLEKELPACKTTNEVVALYKSEKRNNIGVDECSSRAYELAKSETDYQRIVSTFGRYSAGGKKAQDKLNEAKRRKEEKAERTRKILKWALWTAVPLLVILAIYLIFGMQGISFCIENLAGICGLVMFFSGFYALISVKEDGCSGFFISAAIAAVFWLFSAGLGKLANKIDEDDEPKRLYEKIINEPSEELCEEYIQQFPNTDNANKVRDIWIGMLLQEDKDFDYDSFEEETPLYGGLDKTTNPIKKLQDFISKNEGSAYASNAQSAIESICDSLYGVADNKSTEAGWRQYQKIVPKRFYKDSEEKIDKIVNDAWSTEKKAWKTAVSENTESAFTKYKSMYPKGAHIDLCEKKLIDLEVSGIYEGEHETLPEMDQTSYGGGSTSYVTVTNGTSYTLTILYSGPDSKRLVISAGETSSVSLKNGKYRIAASVSASDVRNYAGSEDLQGGNYNANYYISSYNTIP